MADATPDVIQLPDGATKAGAGGQSGEVDLAILPMRSLVLFPSVVLPLPIGREKSVRTLEEATRTQQPLGLLLQRDEAVEAPKAEDLHRFGTLAVVLRFVSGEEGGNLAICQGLQRFEVLSFTADEPILRARVRLIPEPEADDKGADGAGDPELAARFATLKEQSREAVRLMPGAPDEIQRILRDVEAPSQLADMVATFMDIPAAEKQELLEIVDVKQRLSSVSAKLGHLVQVLRLSRDIRKETETTLDKAQREFYLRQQLKTIHKELGEDDEGAAELREVSEAVEQSGMPEEAKAEARRELKRLQRMPQGAAEYGMIRTWLETLTDMPWSRSTEDRLDLAEARRVLDEDHHGLEKVKQRIVEFLAVKKLNPKGQSPILCLVGPPGVGKTSLGQSVARAMGRKFVRVSLGGVHDEAEIRGHRRTYIGAMPGNIAQGLRKAGANNPVFMLDELDKLGQGLHGDPSAALLEVLDPAQNHAFRDNYLNVPLDLRPVMFIATANVIDLIPRPLRDRCEVIQLPGYIFDEKLAIARRYLVPRQLEANGLKPEQAQLEDAALELIVSEYTREAGVRTLERMVGAVLRRAAARIAGGEAERVSIGPDDLQEILGQPRHEAEVRMRTSVAGVATGLAWTPVGGDILFIEATRMPGRNNLILTGQLGDVMRESAQAALSLVKNRAEALGIDPKVFESTDVHVHMPAGAIPKDGPSAGVTLFVALVSLFTGRTVKSDVAMTGEISLRGLVLPVGGIREKVLAALAADIHTVLLPARNRGDYDEVPEKARAELTPIFLETVDDAVEAALDPPGSGDALTPRPTRRPREEQGAQAARRGES